MSSMRLQLFAICALVSLTGAVVAGGARDSSDPLKEIASYREWRRVTLKPITVENFSGVD